MNNLFVPLFTGFYFASIGITPLQPRTFSTLITAHSTMLLCPKAFLASITNRYLSASSLVVTTMLLLQSCHPNQTLFTKIAGDESGIHFNNSIAENDSINPLDLDFLYNGGGVAAGDFNNDGLPDLYFTASTTSNKLYLNKGMLSFTDVTASANVGGEGRWCNAASVVDINNDGWQDIYVCTSIKKNTAARKNLLYVNQGLNAAGIPVFKEMAAAYGLADTSYSVHAAFFDYDNDGDLDMYLVTTQLVRRSAASFSSNKTPFAYTDVDKLFRNDWNDSLQHPFFTDVSAAAGITDHGFGLGVAIADINRDGWKDIYVTNDFYGSDLLYINNKNGTFTNQAKSYFKHTSQNAMGNDVADINNDGLADILAVDMNPEDNYRKKKNMSGNNYFIYQNMLYENIMLQYVRNTLQLNSGLVPGNSDSATHPVFSDISFYAGVAETDWSWSPLMADVNNDGNRDILITNGYPKDVTDHDFISFRNQSQNIASKQMLIEQMPSIKISNYAFKNDGNLQFENTTAAWGMQEPSFSNGAVCLDLDNDGDLDYVINNINGEAFLYKNNTRDKAGNAVNYLTVRFAGSKNNPTGIGAWATVYYDHGKHQVYENSPFRGYLSTTDTKAFFGMGGTDVIDSLVVIWPNSKKQTWKKVPVNQALVADIRTAIDTFPWAASPVITTPLFTDVTLASGVSYQHQETDYIDFDKERLLPHKLSQYGPGLAAGDVNGDGLDDVFIGGSGDYGGNFLLQQPGGQFVLKPLPPAVGKDARRPETMGLLLFDADNDGDLDLYCAAGGNESPANTKNYQDQLYVNDGKGNFLFDTTGAVPVNYSSKSCVRAADFDNDGDLDLFVGGRCLPGQYPMPVSSFIYRNDSKNGHILFTDVTATVAGSLVNAGMICDALWTDFDNDGYLDLIVAGEWMPVSFYKNNHGKFENITATTGLGKQVGWWNSLVAGDFDNDGDIDYIAGNLGQNSFLRASDEYPVSIYAKDMDGNGSLDPILTTYLKDPSGVKKEYTALNRDDIVNQLPGMRRKFSTYKDFGNADLGQLFTPEQLKGAYSLHANNFKSVFIKNTGNGKFEMQPLPVAAQLAPVFGMLAEDINNDGNLDLVLSGNDFGNEVSNGRYDAFNGLLMLGDGTGKFREQTAAQGGFFLPGDAKALVTLRGKDNSRLVIASQNKGPLKIFKSNVPGAPPISLNNDDKNIFISLKNGTTRKEEVYYGHSFLSQSSRFFIGNKNIKKINIVSGKGLEREIVL